MAKKAAHKTMAEVLRKANEKGLHVEVTITEDDGYTRIRVKSITDPTTGETKHYTGSQGNTALRNKLGLHESKKATASRRATAKKQRGKSRSQGGKVLTKGEKNALRRVNRMLKKKGKKERATRKKYAERKKREGAKGVAQAINNTIEHYSGYAYPENVERRAIACMDMDLTKSAELLMSLIDDSVRPAVYKGSKRILDEVLVKVPVSRGLETLIADRNENTREEKIKAIDEELYNVLLGGIVEADTIKKM